MLQVQVTPAKLLDDKDDDVSAKDGADLRYKLIVLNLDRRADRLSNFLQHLSAPLSLKNTCRFAAIDGNDLGELNELVSAGYVDQPTLQGANELLAKHIPTDGGPLTPGGIALYASHVQAMKKIAEDTTIDFGLIAEDDLVHYSPDFESQFARLWNNSAGVADETWRNYGLIWLQHGSSTLWVKGEKRTDGVDTELKPAPGQIWNTAMLAVSREAATKLAEQLIPMHNQIDSDLEAAARLAGIGAAIFEPPIAQALDKNEEGGDTDIQIVLGQDNTIELCK